MTKMIGKISVNKHNSLKISVKDIREAGKLAYHKEEDTSQWDLDVPPGGAVGNPLRLDLELNYLEGEILLTGQAEAPYSFQCSRCLTTFPHRIKATLQSTYESQDVEQIDLWEEIRQSLFLEYPENPLCKPDCKGLCPRCGQDWNQGPCQCKSDFPDPRLEKLKDFKFH